MKLYSWNVNGLRALLGKNEWSWFSETEADIISFQEIKATKDQLPKTLIEDTSWHSFYCSSVVKKGYSGVAVFSKQEPLHVEYELPDAEFQGEGRIIHLEFPSFHFFNGYFPNGGAEILDNGKPTGTFTRVPYKMGFFESFLKYAQELRKEKPIVVCGDFNIAHKECDLARPKQNVKSTGFLPEERAFLDRFVDLGYIDTFRLLHPTTKEAYTWWSYKMKARVKNIGWRIDYFFVSNELRNAVVDATIESDVLGSDHCPISLTLDLKS